MSGEIKLSNVGKAYRNWDSEWDRIGSWFGLPVNNPEEHWVLRNIDLVVRPSETLGIIGQNGAGKSTLLKLITGTTRPTEGAIEKRGRVAAILELGMGFNPDLTGRQNAWHAAGLMGYSPSEIESAMKDIEDFAEIGEYFDQPVRCYSSGMQMRVAFSVATAFVPDILIVDEALSVGDSYFQHKSFNRIRQYRKAGVSIIFVTHGMSDVKTLCDRVVLLDKGRIVKEGLPDEVVDYYNAMVTERENRNLTIEQKRDQDGWLTTRSGTGEVRVSSLALYDQETGDEVKLARVGQKLEVRLRAIVSQDVRRLVLGYMLRDKLGHVVWGTNTWHTHQVLANLRAGDVVEYRLPFECTLGPGSYSVSPALVSTENHLVDNYEWTDNMLVFDVANMDYSVFIGSNWIDTKFLIRINGQEEYGIAPLDIDRPGS
ncbi:ABC transporter ATP-binding protein [Pseudoxanthomonas sp. 22568]|uniref:ABC transporter ATP-binding protein n=1 Tax=Pseudoxanthomonas sp. 22568 TaxID=3453945 RepID=UPI003F8407D9